MDDRSSKILEAAIEEFIGSGEPISSGRLYEEYDFGIKPAMIRLELEKLSEEGFLEQPHHSSGRVPTDRGYEFFAERALAENERRREEGFPKAMRAMFSRHAWADLVGGLSDELGLLSIAGESHKSFFKEGLDSLVENLSNEEDIKSVVRDFVEIDERLARIKKTIVGSRGVGVPQVFVGKKSPVTKSENISVVMRTWESDGAHVLLLAIGPKRMDYKKTVRVFKNL